MTTIVPTPLRIEFLVNLKNRTLDTCKAQGHNMSSFVQCEDKRGIFSAECKACGNIAVINLEPNDKETDVSGCAITLKCGENTD